MADPILINLPTTIDTERLQLRVPQAGDGVALFAAVTESLPELRRFPAFLPWAVPEQRLDSAEIYCRTAQANFVARRDFAFLFFDRTTEQLIGSAGLHRVVWTTPKAEVGYWCRTSRVGNGFVSEAVVALVNFAFEYIGAVRIEIITDEQNIESRRVPERCRFELEGILRNERRAPDGTLRNTCIYARVAPAHQYQHRPTPRE